MRTYLTIRTVAGTFTFLGACVGIKTLPLTWFTLITQTSPFFTAVLQGILLKIRVSKFDLFAMFGAYAGIVLMTMTGEESESKSESKSESD